VPATSGRDCAGDRGAATRRTATARSGRASTSVEPSVAAEHDLTIDRVSVIEWCERCLSEAPSESLSEYAEWLVLSTRDGEYLGIVCAGCIAEPELLALELEDALLGAAA
jgi:hypothetical protein